MNILAFVFLSCLGAAFGYSGTPLTDAEIDDFDVVTIELWQGGERKGRMWPTQDGTINNQDYDHCKQPILVATGFNFGMTALMGRDNGVLTALAGQLSNNSDFNVLQINYNNTHYLTSPPIAAVQIAEFLSVLTKTYGFGGEDVIMVGHSMATMLAGYTSQLFRVGTILAFDPAGPSWDDLPEYLRLDRSDADFVVAIHTSDFVGTLRDDLGHVNLILDGGKYPNGCPDVDLICPHVRGQDMMVDLSSMCSYTFLQCTSYKRYRQGDCDGNPTLALRYDIDKYDPDIPMDGTKYFYKSDVNTGRLSPICRPEERGPVRYYSANLCA